MTSRSMHELLASLLRAQAREQDKVNPAYARVLRARAAGYARIALSSSPSRPVGRPTRAVGRRASF